MYYSSQPPSAYDEGSPESLRKTSLVTFLHNVPPSKRLTDLESRALQAVDASCGFDNVKSDYYVSTEGYAANSSAQFLRSPPSDYYPMETAFPVPPSLPPQMTAMTFTKEDEPQGEISGDAGRGGYDYTSPHSNAPMGQPATLIPQMRTEPPYAHLEESFGKVGVPTHGGIPQQHPPSSTPPTNNANNGSGKAGSTRLQSANTGSTAIIYPWMKRVHSKGSFYFCSIFCCFPGPGMF